MCTILRIGLLRIANFTLPCSLPMKWSDGDVDIIGIQIPKERNYLTPIHFYRKLAKKEMQSCYHGKENNGLFVEKSPWLTL